MPFWKKEKKDPKVKHNHGTAADVKSSPARHIAMPGDRRYTIEPSDRERPRPNSTSPNSSRDRHTIVARGGSNNSIKAHSLSRTESGLKVAQTKAFYEGLTKNSTTASNSTLTRSGQHTISSPEKRRQGTNVSVGSSSTSSSHVSVNITSPTPLSDGSSSGNRTPVVVRRGHSGGSPDLSSLSPITNARINKRTSLIFADGRSSPEISRAKSFDGINLPLPPLQMSNIRLREVEAGRNAPGGGFGFILRKSYLPVPEDPEKTKLVHLVEPRADYLGPLMTGDRIIEVNGENVEDAPHEEVVEMIKSSGGSVYLKVASMPELTELNARGALDDDASGGNGLKRNTKLRKSGKGKAQHKTGTLGRKKNKPDFKAKTEAEVILEREGLEQEKVWLIHKNGFTLGSVVSDSPKRTAQYNHYSMVRSQHRVKITETGEVIDVSDEDIEKANPSQYDKVEDLVKLVHLNESSVMHVLRQRYSSSLIHTFAGRHLIVLNPLRPLSSYVDRVIDMFRGCRREDMPPHIFAMGQQAYRDMMITRQDQSLILMGLSGSGKTFNARYLLRYLTTIGQPDQGPVTNAKLDAVELLLHSFGSAATFLNPQATRCACLYSLDFDPSGTVIGAAVRTFLLEKFRVAQRPNGEGNFNIFYQLFAGADEQLRQDLMLYVPSEIDEPNLYFEPVEDEQRVESAAYVWELIQNCLDMLEISEEEAHGLWSLLAAIYHLGNASVKKTQVRGSDCFMNPAAAQRAATILGIDVEALGRDIFTPPRSASTRLSNLFSSSPSSQNTSDTTSMGSSLYLTNVGGSRTAFLDAFVMGLYDQAFNALVMLINRALLAPAPSNTKRQSSIHVVDMPGFQHRELAGARDGASFDDLCMNYAQERLQMLFHDFTFTSEQDRYMQEEIDWNVLSEVAPSPLPLIDTIDKHVPQRRGVLVDFHTDRRGILWIMDEESVFPGASDSSFLDRVHLYHESKSSMDWGDSPLIKVIKEDNQFTLYHCQRTLPVLYDANGWVWRAREHPSFRVVVQVMAESKRPSIASIFQGRGVAASATTLGSSQLKADTHRTLSRTASTQPTGVHGSPGVKKSSVCLQTKFQVDFMIDLMRKSKQWFIRCILPQLPHKLPGALPSPDPALLNQEESSNESAAQGHIDVPLVRDQLKRAELVKAARIYKQGFPEYVSYPEFRRLYGALMPVGEGDSSMNDKEKAEFILSCAEVEKSIYRLGLSRVFFRAGTLAKLDRQVEESTHDVIVQFQCHCRGWLARQRFEKRKLQESAALVIQQNVLSWLELREFSWWKLFLQVKPMLAIWRAEEDIKDRDEKIAKLKAKVESLEKERDDMKVLEAQMEAKVTQLTAQLEDVVSSANEASDLMENEQMEKRELEEKLNETNAHASALSHENEQLKLQVAEMAIIAQIKRGGDGSGGQDSSEAVLEKYYEAKRELEILKQRVGSEYEDEIERLTAAKKSLEKKLADSEGEIEDMHKSLSQSRKKVAKLGQEMNDLKLLLEAQQGRNAELEKRQRKFDADLNAAKDESSSEVQAKAKLAREKEQLQVDFAELKEKIKQLEEENKQIRQEKEDLESEVLSHTSKTAESELTSLKRIKRDMELKIEELEDELDEVNLKLDTLQQSKARLELSNQTLKQQHQKELEGREEEVEQVRTAMNKKLKALSQQLEDMHEEKQAAVKARRDMERELIEFQSKMADPEMEKKLRKQVKKYKALLEDAQSELDRLKDTRGNSAIVKSLRNQLEDLQASETSANKAQKRLQAEMDEMIIQNDELSRTKIELENRVSDLIREKEDMESRLEDDQDEIEELLEKQRAHISHTSSLQSQLNEATIQIGELEESKISLESRIDEMMGKISELESGVNRHQYEASELKVKELEQKLELERSTARRHEAQINRLRHQLERAQEEKSEDVTHKNSDALRRMQKQLRDLRNDLQEAERREQDALKKKRNAEGRVEELEAQMESSKADLKSAQKRIDTLHSALKGHEDFSGDETREFDETYGDEDDLSSTGSSYKIGDYYDDDDLSGLSDEEGSGLLLDIPSSSRTRTWERSTRSRSRELSPIIDEEEFSSSYGSRRRNRSGGSDEVKGVREKQKSSAEEDTVSWSRRRKGSDLDDDDASAASRRRRQRELDDEDLEDKKATSRTTARKNSFNDTESKRSDRYKVGSDDEPSTRQRRSVSKDKEEEPTTSSSRKSKAKKLADDDDSDDADLEELLRKQKERVRSLIDDDDVYKASSSIRRSNVTASGGGDDDASPKRSRRADGSPGSSPRHETKVNGTSKKGSDSREGSEEPSEGSKLSRRRRQRQRTIELLTSPEHQAIKSNGVK